MEQVLINVLLVMEKELLDVIVENTNKKGKNYGDRKVYQDIIKRNKLKSSFSLTSRKGALMARKKKHQLF